jgi:lipase chaperone LimK
MKKIELLKRYVETKSRLGELKRALASAVALAVGEGKSAEEALDALAFKITAALVKGEKVEERLMNDFNSIRNLQRLYQQAVQSLEDELRRIRLDCNMPSSVMEENEIIRRLRRMIVEEES